MGSAIGMGLDLRVSILDEILLVNSLSSSSSSSLMEDMPLDFSSSNSLASSTAALFLATSASLSRYSVFKASAAATYASNLSSLIFLSLASSSNFDYLKRSTCSASYLAFS